MATEPREVRVKLPREPILTTVPLSCPAAKAILQNCDVCFGLYPSEEFDFEHGMCAKCSRLLIPKANE